MTSDDFETKALGTHGEPCGSSPSIQQYTPSDLVGRILGGFKVEKLIHRGAFSLVYEAFSAADPSKKSILKIPYAGVPEANQADSEVSNRMVTKAQRFITGGVTPVHPDGLALLRAQAERLRAANDPALIKIDELSCDGGIYFMRMQRLEGTTLRALVSGKVAPLRCILELAAAMKRLSSQPRWSYHGDLKPENVVVTDAGIKILDPGHFGRLKLSGGREDDVIVTTPEYYPFLRADDLFAVGIMLWEVVCGIHPLRCGGDNEEAAGERLCNLIRSMARVGQHRLRPLLGISRPRQLRADISLELEAIVLRGLRLHLEPSGKVELNDGFRDFAELHRTLEPFCQ